MSQKVDFMFIGPHPDDCEIGAGGTIALLARKGYKVLIVDLTNGEPTPMGSPEIRAREAQKAAEILGARRITLDLRNRFLFDCVEARFKLASVIRTHKPEVIFCHAFWDAHPDHWNAYLISYAGRFYGKLTRINLPSTPHYAPKIYHFYCSHLRRPPNPKFVVDITETFTLKIEALKAYKSQFNAERGTLRVLEWVEAAAKYWGRFAGTAYAEPFESHEPITLSDPAALAPNPKQN